MSLFVGSLQEAPESPENGRFGYRSPTDQHFPSDHASDQHVPEHVSVSALTIHVAHMADILATLQPVGRYALVVFGAGGVAFFAEYNHILTAQVTVDAALFATYDADLAGLDHVLVGVDVHLLADAFAAAAASKNSAVTCYMRYAGGALVVEFEDRLISETIEFSTFLLDLEYPGSQGGSSLLGGTSNSQAGLSVNHDALRLEIIVKSDVLANVLQDLQSLNTEDLYMVASPEDGLHFVSKGAIGYSKLVYPKAKTMPQKLEVYGGHAVAVALAFPSFIRVFRAVRLSSKCKIMGDSENVLSLQLLCKTQATRNYSGTLITFNMLERLDAVLDTDFAGLFDDSLYHTVREYDATEPRQPAASLSYASFRTPQEPQETVGAVDIPYFL